MIAILSGLVGRSVDNFSEVIKQGWHDIRPFMTGCLISTTSAYSICSGTVIDVGKDDKNLTYSVTVEYEYLTWIRYCLLKSCDVEFGDKVSIGTKIGDTYNKVLRFEYCTNDDSRFPTRIGLRCLYKQDPMVILDGSRTLPDIDDEVAADG